MSPGKEPTKKKVSDQQSQIKWAQKPNTEAEKLESKKQTRMFDKGLTPAYKILVRHDQRSIRWDWESGNDASRAGHKPQS